MFPMKTGGTTQDFLPNSDKTLILSMADALVQEIIKIIHVISSHHPHIQIINKDLMLKCIKYAVLDPNSIGAKINKLLDYTFMNTESDEAEPPPEIASLTENIKHTYGKHYDRINIMEQKFNESLIQSSDKPSYLRPKETDCVTKPLIKKMLSDYFDELEEDFEADGEGDECDEECDECDEDCDECDEECDQEEEYNIEAPEQSILTCSCSTCAGIMQIGQIHEFDSKNENNPFIKAIMNSMTKLESRFGQNLNQDLDKT
jgi:hypothetical protein